MTQRIILYKRPPAPIPVPSKDPELDNKKEEGDDDADEESKSSTVVEDNKDAPNKRGKLA